MSNPSTRLNLYIDIFDQLKQHALALPTLSGRELVAEILKEFRELEFLSDDPTRYQLLKVEDHTPLLADKTLGEQLKDGQYLLFEEITPRLPDGATSPSQTLYLRESSTGKVFTLHWLPALIGRPHVDALDNDLLAVNLESFKTGMRVSRRHAQIIEEAGQFLVESLSQNPTTVEDSEGNRIPSIHQRIQSGDQIHLERSGISFKCIIR